MTSVGNVFDTQQWQKLYKNVIKQMNKTYLCVTRLSSVLELTCVLLVNTAFHNFKLVTEVKVYFEKEKNIYLGFLSPRLNI